MRVNHNICNRDKANTIMLGGGEGVHFGTLFSIIEAKNK